MSASIKPERSASSVCSASDGQWVDAGAARGRAPRFLLFTRFCTGIKRAERSDVWLNVETDEHAIGIGKVADDLANRRRQPPHQRGDGEYLVSACERGVLQEVDHLDAIFASKVVDTNALEVCERGRRLLRIARHI